MSTLADAQLALAELRKTSLGFTKAQIANSRAFRQTHSGVTESALVRLVNALGGSAVELPVPKPPPPPGPAPLPTLTLQQKAQRIIFCTDHALKTTVAPRSYARALTADPTYGDRREAQDFRPLGDIISTLKALNPLVYAWGNQSQIGVAAIKKFAVDWGLVGCIYQSENPGELADIGVEEDGSIQPGSLVATEQVIHIGNPTAWTAQQRATVTELVGRGRMAVIVEVYNNLMPWVWPDNYDSMGVPVAAWSPAFYDGKGESASGRYTTRAEYAAHSNGKPWSPYTSGDSHDDDLRTLP